MTTPTTITTITTMTMTTSEAGWLPPLVTWLSPAYPVGAYCYSHGLEWAVETGQVADRASLVDYVTTAIEAGGGWSDLVILAAVWRAARADDDKALGDIAELAFALRGTAETALESTQQGNAFVLATRAAWPGTPLDALARRYDDQLAYPVAVGAAAAKSVPLEILLPAYAHAFAANLVSAGLRLIPLGQTDGLKALAGLAATLHQAAMSAAVTPLDALGCAAPGIDFCSIHHETQYTRLFRS